MLLAPTPPTTYFISISNHVFKYEYSKYSFNGRPLIEYSLYTCYDTGTVQSDTALLA